MNKKLSTIVGEETLRFIRELIDPNAGNTYYPKGLNPKVVKLFEDLDDTYNMSLDDEYWKQISKKFPEYNDPNSPDCKKAIDYILNGMKKKYPDENWGKIESEMRSKIHGGIT